MTEHYTDEAQIAVAQTVQSLDWIERNGTDDGNGGGSQIGSQKLVPTCHLPSRPVTHAKSDVLTEAAENEHDDNDCHDLTQDKKLGVEGFEPRTDNLQRVDGKDIRAESNLPCPQIGSQEFVPDLQVLSWIVARWGSLSDATKRKIVRLIGDE